MVAQAKKSQLPIRVIEIFLFDCVDKISDSHCRVMSPRANNSEAESEASDRAVVNDSLVDCQSREVTEVKFSAENLARPLVQVVPQPCCADKIDDSPKKHSKTKRCYVSFCRLGKNLIKLIENGSCMVFFTCFFFR